MLEVAELDRLSDRLLDIGSPFRALPLALPHAQTRANMKRPMPYQQASSSRAVPRLMPPPQRLAITMRPPSPTVDSFAFAVKDYPDSISIMSNRYAKAPIRERLNLTEDDICLAAYLSDKGAAACPHSRVRGHERADSHTHIFSDAAQALRPIFEQHPFKIGRSNVNAPAARRQAERPASRAASQLRLQYNPPPAEQARPPPAPLARAAGSQHRSASAPIPAPVAVRPAPSVRTPAPAAASTAPAH